MPASARRSGTAAGFRPYQNARHYNNHRPHPALGQQPQTALVGHGPPGQAKSLEGPSLALITKCPQPGWARAIYEPTRCPVCALVPQLFLRPVSPVIGFAAGTMRAVIVAILAASPRWATKGAPSQLPTRLLVPKVCRLIAKQ